MRGCPRLVAVWKPGRRTVCLATGGPARLVSKLVELEDAPTALGVIETSFVATFADGRAALYDGDAIVAAGDGAPISPKHVSTLGVRGKPETLVLTTKGGTTLWIGTSTGEVVSGSLVKKGAGV